METKRIYIKDTEHVRDEELLEAAEIIRRGGLVAFPTETVYGLGGNALDEGAAKKIYAAKGRPSDNPLIAHVSCPEEVEPLVEYMPEAGKKLMEAFWPGPLTLYASVGVMDQTLNLLCSYASDCHFQSFHCVTASQSITYAIPNDLLRIGVCHQRQVAEHITAVRQPYGNVSDITNPQLIRMF